MKALGQKIYVLLGVLILGIAVVAVFLAWQKWINLSERFNVTKIEKLDSFEDSRGNSKKIFVYNTAADNGKIGIYITDNNLKRSSAVTIFDNIIGSETRNSPYVSWKEPRPYIAIELAGADTLDLVVVDEDGKIIAKSVKSQDSQRLGQYQISFAKWETASSFWATAVPYPEGLPGMQLLIDAATGKIIEEKAGSQ